MNWALLANPGVWWGLAAAVPAVLAEYLYRTLEGPWWKYLWVWLPIQLAISYCIWRLLNTPGQTLLDSFIIWAFSTTFLRVVVSVFILQETIKLGTWTALGLLLLARVAQTFMGR